MELTQYVKDEVTSIGCYDEAHNFQASAELRDAALKTTNEQETRILNVVSDALLMRYNDIEQKFTSLEYREKSIVAFCLEQASEEEIVIIEKVADIANSSWIRAKLFHIAWSVAYNPKDGQCAVEEYLCVFKVRFDPEEWTTCYRAIQRAFHIAIKLGNNSDAFQQTQKAINQALDTMNGSDPLFLSLHLIELVIKNATNKEITKYLQMVSKLADRNLSASNLNTNLADETIAVYEKLLTHLNQRDKIVAIKKQYVSYYEAQAKIYEEKGDYFRAIPMMQKAIKLLDYSDREKRLSLRLHLEELQKKSLSNMHMFSHKFTLDESIYKNVVRLFEGLSVQETIVQLGRITPFFQVEDIKQKVREQQQNFAFISLFGGRIINEKGQTIQNLPPLNEVDFKNNSELLHKYMVRYVSEQCSIFGGIVLVYIFELLRNSENFSEETLDFLVRDNLIIPKGRADIFREGFYLGLTGKLYASLHILLPQTENLIRNLVKICGDVETNLKNDGTEEVRPLSALFKSDKLHECYSEDIIFSFQSIMDDPAGENLRNLCAHGILEPRRGNSGSTRYFISLLIKLLSMYSTSAWEVLKQVGKRDPR